jgi:hypothetical protein
MKLPVKVSVDFNNCDAEGRVRLTTNGALEDIERLQIKLEPDLKVLLDDNEGLAINGIVEFSKEENIWVAKFDWNKLNNIF